MHGVSTRRSSFAFLARFVLAFLLLYAGWESIRGTTAEEFIVVGCIALPSAALVNALTPGERATVVERTLRTEQSRIRITRGCEGVETVLLLLAAVLAFPAGPRMKLTGLGVGLIVAYALALSRIVLLHYVLRHAPGAWQAMHGVLAPLLPVAGVAIFFLYWSARAARELRAA